jgi:pimeloyl-ACP methyl ester carboxylesterase
MGKTLELTIAVLNGAVGDYLARTGNGLATTMACVHDGRPLPLEPAALARAHPEAGRRVVLLVHGLMCSEDIWKFPDGEDYGSRLARDLGYTPLYLRFNSGLAIAENGRLLAKLIEQLLAVYPQPIDELLLVGYSLGGLVVRSACQVARRDRLPWLERVERAIYVGKPHRGAPLERWGRIASGLLSVTGDPYAQLAAQLAELRSTGVKNLGDADPVPLLPQLRHYLVAGTLSNDPWLMALFGDFMVPVASATDGRAVAGNVKIVPGVGHMGLAHHEGVYAQIRAWCEEGR